MTSEKSYGKWYFLAGVILAYIIVYFTNPEKIYPAFLFFKDLIFKILPILLFIFILMVLTNYFIQPKTLVKYLGHSSGIKGWVIAIVSGILSTGPIYLWYPLLNELQKHGMRNALIATFLYNRSVKIPLLPLLVAYFGIKYSIILLTVTLLVSVLQGWTTEKILIIFEKKEN